MLRCLLVLLILFAGSDLGAAINDLPGAPDAPAYSPPATRAIVSGPHNFDLGDPTMPLRLLRDGNPSQCDPAKAFPGTWSDESAPYRYKTYTFYNTGPGTCVTVQFDVGDCDVNVHLAAYRGSFNPADLSENYLGDVGSSVSQPFSFVVPLGETVVIMAHENWGGSAGSCGFSFSSDELSPTRQRQPIPALNTVGVGVLCLALLAFAYYRMRRTAQ
ncbi:MAG: hypothetical protein C4548_09680 [Desulfobacteraceae bacterium]|nr:MAG: hypothetical protein C4548_09680 [Desulfobacteraceae bacterium]